MPLPVVGVVGGGQLARMMQQEAIHLGLDVRYLVDSSDDPVVTAGGAHSVGSATDADALARFAASVDVLTFDHEVVDLGALAALEADGVTVRPSAATFATVSDKRRMRAAMAAAGLPTPSHVEPASGADAAALVEEHGPHVFKLSHGGYDGRGTHFVSDPGSARDLVDGIVAAGGRVLAEPRLDLEAELAVLVVRTPDAKSLTYEPVRTIQVDGQCRLTHTPSGLGPDVIDRAQEMGRAAAEAVDAVGILAVELFLTDGGLLVNELAARPHNSGHHTLDATVTSQFENHLRAVAGLALGAVAPTCVGAAMANVIGCDAATDPRHRLAEGLGADPGARIHLYDKAPRRDRKLGHVTVCDDSVERAVGRVRRVVAALGGQEVPE